MTNESENINITRTSNISDHLANERTFLAWIRTSIGIMAFGFVVEKFSIFVKQIAALLGKQNLSPEVYNAAAHQGYSSVFGVLLVAFGLLICLFSFIKFKRIEKQIVKNTYYSSSLLDTILTGSVLLIGIFLIVYLINNI